MIYASKKWCPDCGQIGIMTIRSHIVPLRFLIPPVPFPEART
jgi:hypothetical protein